MDQHPFPDLRRLETSFIEDAYERPSMEQLLSVLSGTPMLEYLRISEAAPNRPQPTTPSGTPKISLLHVKSCEFVDSF